MTLFRKKSTETQVARGTLPPEQEPPPRKPADQVLDLAVLLSQQNDFAEILRLIVEKGLPLFNADMLSVMMVNPVTQHTIKTVMRDGMAHDEHSLHLLRVNITGWVMKHRQPFLSEDLSDDTRFARDLSAEGKICSVMCVPMQRENQILGQILVVSKERSRRFGSEDLALLEKCAAVWGAFLSDARRVQEYFQSAVPDDVLVSKYTALGLHGKSPRFRELLRSVDAASKCDVRVFLEGPTGSGKELVARAIHKLGARREHPFVAIDCGAIPAGLIESELFGHVKGAFTGASQSRRGLLEEADGGTLFMDEIGNLPYDLQSKLLRVLEEGEVRAIGGNLTRKVDVRIITASRTSAAKLVREMIMREDLFYRLHVYPIAVPTLHERTEDIPLLAEHFLKEYAARQGKKAELFQPSIVHFMREKLWEGNVRELENFIERMVTVAPPEMTMLDDKLLPPEYLSEYRAILRRQPVRSVHKPLRDSLQEQEYQILREALIAHGWNQSEAARALNISERAMRYKMKRLHLARPDTNADRAS